MNQIKKIKFVFQEVLRLYLIFIFIFQIFRITIYFSYPDLFNNLNLLKLFGSIFLGLRFDLASISVLLFIPIVLLIFPLKIAGNRLYRGFIGSVIYIELVAVIIFLTSDYLYFSYVKRHITNELLFLLNDSKYLLTEASNHLLPIIIIIFFTVLIYPIFLKHTYKRNPEGHRSVLSFIVVVLIMIVVGRGGLQMKPIAVIDAY